MTRALAAAALSLFLCLPVSAQAAKDAAFYYNEGQRAALDEDYYSAVEAFLECVRRNPAHAEAAAALASAYYELGEYDEALTWIRKARALARLSPAIANLEAFILIAVGRLPEAEAVIKDVLAREPYNREALFAAAELDIARGRAGDAVIRYKGATRLYGDDRRLLVSLALVLGSLGDYSGAASYIERAQVEHPDDYRVFYYAAYLASRAGRVQEAIRAAERSLFLRPGNRAAQDLLASLRYRAGDYVEAIKLADHAIARERNNTSAWYLKGMSLWRLARLADARVNFQQALGIDGNDEFIRAAYEELLLESTAVESAERRPAAEYHFSRAAEYRKRGLSSEALFEYRRGLRLNPYAAERRNYAETLRLLGYPSLALDELEFMTDLGKGDRAANDLIETYRNILSTSLSRQWPVESSELKPHWNVAIFSMAAQSAFFHTDAGFVAASYLKDIMSHSRPVNVPNGEIRVPSFAQAFRTARESVVDGARCDYFLITTIGENDRSLSFKAELFTARTGSKVAEWTAVRTGQNRLRAAALEISARLEEALPFRAVLLRRNADRALMDKGKIDGVKAGNIYTIIRKGRLEAQTEGLGFKYLDADVAGTFAVGAIDEEISSGTLTRNGFFDVISPGDELIVVKEEADNGAKQAATAPAAADPELRTLLKSIR
ncbi:MAG: tetratricopeptide repeat protein [Spirochaetaceae bacterium]|jgi:tetratricopeptide (TPR) repeat protein|nr:tetratricopeptide repeat protein [Spirochaetaceae bacterium]